MQCRSRQSFEAIAVRMMRLCAALFLASCDQRGGGNERAVTVKQTDIVAPPGEPSFPEKYHLKLTLPMPEFWGRSKICLMPSNLLIALNAATTFRAPDTCTAHRLTGHPPNKPLARSPVVR